MEAFTSINLASLGMTEEKRTADLKNHVGDLAKDVVRAHLTEAGFAVFEKRGISSYGDFVIAPSMKIVKVKTGRRLASGALFTSAIANTKYDVLAVVLFESHEIIYIERGDDGNT